MALYLLDTSVCVPVLRERASLRELPEPDETAISAIVAAELWVGACKLGRESSQYARLVTFLGLFEILPFSSEASVHYGEIRADLEQKGISIGPLDLLIAAHARSLDATLITANASEFKRVKGLKLLTWK